MLVKQLSQNPTFHKDLIKLIGNIFAGDSEDSDEMLKYGALDLFKNLMNTYMQNNETLKEIFWAISNVTAGTLSNIREFIDSDLLKNLLLNLNKISSEIVMTEYTLIFANAIIGCNTEEIIKLLNYNILDMYLYILEHFNSSNVIKICLQSLKNLFKHGKYLEKNEIVEAFCQLGGPAILENLFKNPNSTVRIKVEELVKEYFSFDCSYDNTRMND